jgi:hypothetical protein
VDEGVSFVCDLDLARGTGLLGLPQAMFNFSQKLTSSPGSVLQVYSSLMVFNEFSPDFVGELLLVGSGVVPHDESGPRCDTDDADGEVEIDGFEPLPRCCMCVASLRFWDNKSNGEVLVAELRIDGLKRSANPSTPLLRGVTTFVPLELVWPLVLAFPVLPAPPVLWAF